MSLQKIIETPLSNFDIDKYFEPVKTSIVEYSQLQNMNTFPFDADNKCIIFFASGQNIGHWLCVLNHEEQKLIEWFDSYGLQVGGDVKWLSKQEQKQLNEYSFYAKNIMKNYANNGYKTTYNNFDFQSKKPDINTCGRWCVVRSMCYNMLLPEFKQYIQESSKKLNLSLDGLVAYITDKL